MYVLVRRHDTPDGPAEFGSDHEPCLDQSIAQAWHFWRADQ